MKVLACAKLCRGEGHASPLAISGHHRALTILQKKSLQGVGLLHLMVESRQLLL
jgi:hypothetical protein